MSALRLTRLQRIILLRLAAAKGAVVTHAALLHAMYGDDPDGGPISAQGVMKVQILQMRRLLPPGAIINEYGVGYRLDPAIELPSDLRVDDARLYFQEAA